MSDNEQIQKYIKSVFFRANEQYVSLSLFGVMMVICLGIFAPFNYITQKIRYRKLLKEANKSERRRNEERNCTGSTEQQEEKK